MIQKTNSSFPKNYQEAGVSIEKGDIFTKKIKHLTKDLNQENVKSGIGGFAALYDQGDHYLVSGTDGVGTKIKLAIDTDFHSTIGIDLVAMCANDILCTGAKPLFFLDYLATGNLNLETSEEIIKGIIKGCQECHMPLIGGETAEMPDFYSDGHYDLAGFCLGEVSKKKVIDGSRVAAGDILLGLPSSGFHSNGFSLLRKYLAEDDFLLKKELLTPTKIYVQEILSLKEVLGTSLKGLAHITGSGFENIPRMNANFSYRIENAPKVHEMPLPMQEMLPRLSSLSSLDLYQTFNMGVGLVFATDKPYLAESHLKNLGIQTIFIGHIEEKSTYDKEKTNSLYYDFLNSQNLRFSH